VSPTPALDLSVGAVRLAAALVDVPSESRHEGPLADAVELALRDVPWLDVQRRGNTVVARTQMGRSERVLIGGHLDTVPEHGNLPHRIDGDLLYGLGACDMKGGVAVALSLAGTVSEPVRDVTYVLYECEEIDASLNGLKRLADDHPQLLVADLAILMEPSDAGIEAGCQGTLRVEVTTRGTRAHSARSWLGDNAIHAAGAVLDRLRDYVPRQPLVDGLQYREGMNAVGISGGVAGNVIPDACVVTVNYRFAPDRSLDDAIAHVREVFDGFEVTVTDAAPGALPGLDRRAAADFVAAIGETPRPKFGWTDVARFSGLGVPALNFGPGDPALAHTRDEHVPLAQIASCEERMRRWLTGA
jgi:succinyl-diaminopimelate desuccinylase